MAIGEYNCPSCGAPLVIENRFTQVVICEYCGQTSRAKADGLDPQGEKGQLADFESVLAVGRTGRIPQGAFKVLGRLRYKYDGGFWDEWFLRLNSEKNIWLQEDEGEFTAFEKESLTSPLPPYANIRVGSFLDVNGQKVFVTEKSSAMLTGGQGELCFRMVPGQIVQCVDGNSQGRLISIEFSPDEIVLSAGEEIDVSQIEIEQ